MTNLSLARIMYGTNADLHAWRSMNAPAVSSLATPLGEHSTAQAAAPASGSLSRLLQKAWTALYHKS